MLKTDAIIIGAGPCGLSAAIHLKRIGLEVLLIEKGSIVNSIHRYPTHQTFFSSSMKLSIGNIPFITAKDKPQRNDALVYYRTVAELEQLKIHSDETVLSVEKTGEVFHLTTEKALYETSHVIVATGYYDQPNRLEAVGADLPHVHHYFKEAHPYFQKNVVVIGGKNSAVDAALELQRAGANVTVVYRGATYSPSVKPWILPGFESLVKNGEIRMIFQADVEEITEDTVRVQTDSGIEEIQADAVFAMIGYHPDYDFLGSMGIQLDEESGCPIYNEETMETSVKGLYIAGVIAAGNNANSIFIENGRHHGEAIALSISDKLKADWKYNR
ncbi:YpdA family putative bacillithiol disulfide reductase [Sporosarcina gallistercoris]|uniref:YpdA family putative bacillithiol disulfide reductase n=1 Tax=Sporosarcina gallistercoris TaxID=2762245 RepID=A0ABR8PFM0_9BACL|nr:YpdA family putative bacillithiol disulfide reductase [Sporosarcina gallistercoris]MBD7906975.1 YpdA family putative bacillithiol disulfide reductase [Sporosarcina gallistercoris]